MVMSVMEARIPPDKWETFKDSFLLLTNNLPPRICQTMLIQSVDDPLLWKMITIWRIKKSPIQLQKEIEEGGALRVFQSIGIEPTQANFNIALSAQEQDLGSDLTETPIADMLSPSEDNT